MLFPKADIDKTVQIGDMFRIDMARSFHTGEDIITEVNIFPDFIGQPALVYNVYEEDQSCWFLDYAYDTAGSYQVKVELVTASDTSDRVYTVEAITEEDDNLLANDTNLYTYESELKRYIPEGRNSWIYVHRKARDLMLDYLYRKGKVNSDGSEIDKSQLTADSHLREWATFEAMLLIFQDIKTSNSEAFNQKIEDYSMNRNNARERYIIKFDSNKDGIVDEDDSLEITTKPKFFTR